MRLWQCLGCIALLALGLLISALLVQGLIDLQARTCPTDAFLRGSPRWTAALTYLPAVGVGFTLAAVLLGEMMRRLRWVGARRVGATNLPLHPIWLAAALLVAVPPSASFALAGICAGPEGITARSSSFTAPQTYRWPDVRRVVVACWQPLRGGELIDVTLEMPGATPVPLPIGGSGDLPGAWQNLRQALDGVAVTYDFGEISTSCSPATRTLFAPSPGSG